MDIRHACVELLALSASGTREWSTVGRRRVGRSELILSEELPVSVTYRKRRAARRDRVPVVFWQFDDWYQAVASGGGSAHDPPPLVPEDGGAGGVEREAWSVENSGQQSVKPKAGNWR
jgi:hypothetical protein